MQSKGMHSLTVVLIIIFFSVDMKMEWASPLTYRGVEV